MTWNESKKDYLTMMVELLTLAETSTNAKNDFVFDYLLSLLYLIYDSIFMY